MSTRKPHCHTCNSPMKGHKRRDGVTICPIPQSTTTTPSFPASPPETPPRLGSTSVKVSHSPTPALATIKESAPFLPTPPHTLARPGIDPSFVIPEKGPWHRRNPNWEENTPPPEQPVLRGASLVPTVLVDDDGNTVQGSQDGGNSMDPEMNDDDDDDDDKSEDIDPFRQSIEPVICIYSAKHEDLQRLGDEAASMGVYTGTMRNPVKFKLKAERAHTSALSEEGLWLLVVSRNPDFVKLVINSQEHRTAGAKEDRPTNGPQVMWVTNKQLIVNGLVSALVAVFVLSLL